MATKQDCLNQIDRIEGAKSALAEAIEEKGVEVPQGASINRYPELVRQIQSGSPNAVLFTPQELTSEQQAQARENIGAGTYSKPGNGIPDTDLAQGVRNSLQKADEAYKKPIGGIPSSDMAQAVQQSLQKADLAYQKPGAGIPESDLAQAVKTSLGKANTALQPAALDPITELIPEQATAQNKLADKNFVNSSIATNTANYISDNGQPFTSVADLEAYSGPLTNNDYAFVVGTDSAGNTTYTRYKYNATTGQWAAEYVLNNSSFTAAQWAAISSGITALLVQKLSDLPTEVVTYVSQTLTDAQKQQARTNIGATAPEVFIATYGTTTATELETALAANKIIITIEGTYVYFYVGADASYHYFSCTYAGVKYRIARCKKTDNVWSLATYDLQVVANKADSIIGNESNTTKYPNTKAVADFAVQALTASGKKIWAGTQADYALITPANDTIYFIIPAL